MSTRDLRKIENHVLKLLRQEGPLRTSELLRQHASEMSAPVLRRAVWSLVDDGRAEFTSDRRVRALVPTSSKR